MIGEWDAGAASVDVTPADTSIWLDGWGATQVGAARHPIYPGLPNERGCRVAATWVVRGAASVSITWDAGRGGCGVVQVET